jgi:hypothetical protein
MQRMDSWAQKQMTTKFCFPKRFPSAWQTKTQRFWTLRVVFITLLPFQVSWQYWESAVISNFVCFFLVAPKQNKARCSHLGGMHTANSGLLVVCTVETDDVRIGTSEDAFSPLIVEEIAFENVVKVAASSHHSIALTG